MTNSTLPFGRKGAEAFHGRGINPETVAKYGVYTARKTADGSVQPHESGNIIVFPFLEREVVVNEKFRAPGKKFWQTTGGRKTFWNADALDDPALADVRHPLVITEGEIDALTAIDCGWPLTVSVPDGAPPAEGELKQLDDDSTGKFQFMFNNRDRLKRVHGFIIATDSDAPGKRLAEELVRRLTAARCSFVTYPDDCKDLNEVLMRHGADRVRVVLSNAMPYPVKGIFQASQYPKTLPRQTYGTGWETIDRHFQLFAPSFTVVTGIPGHGKSTWITNLIVNAARLHGWRSAVFSPEMPASELLEMMQSMTGDDPDTFDAWVEDRIIFIDHDNDEQDITLDWIIDRTEDCVLRHGVRILVIDPWNEVEHAKRRDESSTEYIGRAIRDLKRLARKHHLAIFVLAHPTKDVAHNGNKRVPGLYDIDGSAHWFNKPDCGIVIDRDMTTNQTAIYISKIRFRGTGKPGKVMLSFNEQTSRYGLLNE